MELPPELASEKTSDIAAALAGHIKRDLRTDRAVKIKQCNQRQKNQQIRTMKK